MASMFERGRAMLARHGARAAGVPSITVTRVGVGSFTVTNAAWVGTTLFRLMSETGGSRMEWADRDYMIPGHLYDFGSGPVEPAEHDRITETINGVTQVFDVMAPDAEPAWRWSDSGQTLLRVHTKRVG